jgi:zinc protease
MSFGISCTLNKGGKVKINLKIRWMWIGLIMAIILLGGCARFTARPEIWPNALVVKELWPHEASDLTPDPAAEFGRLPNGFRYVLKENQTPRDRVSMHLYIQAGSMSERENEEGLAHFLEHMLFNGTDRFPPGEMVKYFQRIGMQFGPDANARTGFSQTVYDILLPKGDDRSISEGLLVMKEFAQGALLLQDLVETEKGVVLAEKRSRDSAQFRTLKSTFQFEMPGTLPARRFPIGSQADIEAFDTQLLRGFYDAWYRPERMILVMAGQFDQSSAKQMIAQQFGSMQPRGDQRPLPEFGRFQHQGIKAFHHYEKESGTTTVRIHTAEQIEAPADNAAYRQEMLMRQLADWIVQKRLDTIVQQQESIFITASVGSGDYLQQIRFAEISADSRPENWDKALAAVEQELRRALTHGFTPSELQRAKNNYAARLQREVNAMNTRDSKDIAREIMAALNQWQVYQSPRQRLDLMTPLLEAVTLEQVHQAFKDTWSAAHRLVLVTGNADLSTKEATPVDRIMSVFNSSLAVDVQALEDKMALDFPYLPVPAAGSIQERSFHEDLDITEVKLANGVRLIFKPTRLRENEVLASLSFGRGKSSEPADQPGLAHLTEAVVNESGFGAMSRNELESALAGRLAGISLNVREDMFVVGGHAASAEIELLFQLLYTFVEDPGLRPEALSVAMNRLEKKYRSFGHSVEGLMQVQGENFLADGDSRFGWPEWEQMQKLSLEQIGRWFGGQLNQSPLEIALVGDFQPDQVVELAARYFGALAPRTAPRSETQRPAPGFPHGQSLQLVPDTEIQRGLVTTAYLTDDFWDIQRTRRLSVLAELLSERLRVHIRETLGAVYSPYARHRAYRAFANYGLLQTFFLVDPAQADFIAGEVDHIAARLAEEGISQDELRRALDPTLSQIKDLRQSNGYWLNSVLTGSTRHPEQLEWARNIEEDYASISEDEMNTLAKKYLRNDQAAVIIILPQNK